MDLLKGKTAIITGASTGIGRTTAKLFASEGASVVVAARSEDKLKSLVEEIEAEGGKAVYAVTDITNKDSICAMVQKSVDSFGRLDIAINAASISPDSSPIYEMDEELFDRIIATDYRGTTLCTKYEIRQMIECGNGGSIVNVSSGGVRRQLETTACYLSSKAAIETMSQIAAHDAGKYGIRVNALRPGTILTPMMDDAIALLKMDAEQWGREHTYLGRLGEPIDIAKTLLMLSSDYASYVTAAILDADGGLVL